MVLILRHNSLNPPFDDYDRLDFSDLIGLSQGTISPDISSRLVENPWGDMLSA